MFSIIDSSNDNFAYLGIFSVRERKSYFIEFAFLVFFGTFETC